ncbi:hypothetical protein HCY66_00705 [Acinetobacter radioresistens]|uniref:hypothetical protein n=1 Tax=Acinetobacter radioresistens TaxID=40216 RepID=UPI0020036882|nr:hypothetical protein [Acinetobacter radioresistens]MCK4088604.1 hypothetical protein [Acinetobacter radioresistens]
MDWNKPYVWLHEDLLSSNPFNHRNPNNPTTLLKPHPAVCGFFMRKNQHSTYLEIDHE